jgi:hypothetical protein
MSQDPLIWKPEPVYHLTERDWDIAQKVGRLRSRNDLDRDIIGATGEVAFRGLFLPWFDLGNVKTFSRDDAGWDFDMPDGVTIDVKTITDPMNNLLVPKNPRAGKYVLVWFERDAMVCHFMGWTTGGRAVVDGSIASWGTHYVVLKDKLSHFTSFLTSYDPAHPRATHPPGK